MRRLASAGNVSARDRGRSVAAHAGAAPPAGPRLRLEQPEPLVARATPASAPAAGLPGASVALSAGATPSGEAPAPVATAPVGAEATMPATADVERAALRLELAQERERIRLLEGSLAQLRSDAQATQKSVAVLQARLRTAEGERYANPLVYVLGGLCAVLAGAAALAWRWPRGRRRWWEATRLPAAAAAAPVPLAPTAPAPADVGVAVNVDDPPWTYQRPRLDPAARPAVPAPTSIGGLEVTTVIDHALLARVAAGEEELAAAAPADAPPMEELIDLEQQVEFFVVLGQEERAIELLSSHLRGGAGASPLPYYGLLEIHRRRGEEKAYARVAETFHQRFGAYAPSWAAEVDQAGLLEEHPQVIARLQQVWDRPHEAMRALDAWIFRRQHTDAAFDFGAYRELLFLYSIARDLAGSAPTEAIDLLLPLDAGADDAQPSVHPAILAAYGAVEVPLRPALDLDISLPGPFDTRPSKLRQAV
jgi:hypothetical protein